MARFKVRRISDPAKMSQCKMVRIMVGGVPNDPLLTVEGLGFRVCIYRDSFI